MPDEELPHQCNDGIRWMALVERYPELPDRERVALDNHIEQRHCSACKSTRDQLIRVQEALESLALDTEDTEQARDWQIAQEAQEAKAALKAKVMRYWDTTVVAPAAETAENVTRRRPAPLPEAQAACTSASWRPAKQASRATQLAGFARSMMSSMMMGVIGVIGVIGGLWHVSVYILQPLARLLSAVMAPFDTMIVWCLKIAPFGPIPGGRPRNSRPSLALMSLALILSSVVTGCVLATMFLRMMLIHGPVRWWNLALVTGLTTAIACVMLVVGVLIAGNHLLQGYGWKLSDLGKLLFSKSAASDSDSRQKEEMMNTTLRLFLSSVGLENYDTAFTVTHKIQPQHRDNVEDDPLVGRMAFFDELLRDFAQELSSDARQLSWTEFQRAWYTAFRPKRLRTTARNSPSKAHQGSVHDDVRYAMADSLIQTFQYAGDDQAPAIECKWLAPTGDTPAALVCVTRPPQIAATASPGASTGPDERENVGRTDQARPTRTTRKARYSIKRLPQLCL